MGAFESNLPVQEKCKFSHDAMLAKRKLRQLRLDRQLNMNQGARLMGISRKQLEDIETTRNYGCHLSFEILAAYCKVYKTSLNLGPITLFENGI